MAFSKAAEETAASKHGEKRGSSSVLAGLGNNHDAGRGRGGVAAVSLQSHFGRDAEYFELVEKGGG